MHFAMHLHTILRFYFDLNNYTVWIDSLQTNATIYFHGHVWPFFFRCELCTRTPTHAPKPHYRRILGITFHQLPIQKWICVIKRGTLVGLLLFSLLIRCRCLGQRCWRISSCDCHYYADYGDRWRVVKAALLNSGKPWVLLSFVYWWWHWWPWICRWCCCYCCSLLHYYCQ